MRRRRQTHAGSRRRGILSRFRPLGPAFALRAAVTLASGGALIGVPSPASAQFGVFDALARRFSDVSFFGSAGGLLPRSSEVRAGTMTSFGVEVLFQIGSIERTLPPRPEDPGQPRDSVRIRWTGMEVVRSEGRVDTVYTYEVEARPPPAPPTEPLWLFELGVGYGQLSGFNSRDASLDLKGSVRSLPFISLYGTYEPVGVYAGLRSGFMKLDGLQVFDSEGEVFSGDGDSFLAGAVLGYAVELLGINVFVEGSYTARDFPSVEWDGGPLPAGIPREMSLSGWTIGGGVQFSVDND